MKNFRRVFAVVLTFMLLITGLTSSFGVSAAAATVYECDLGVDKTKSGQFEFMAFDINQQLFFSLETTSKATWSPDWPGHFVPGKDVYTVSKSEIEKDGALIDLMCDQKNNWGSAVVFTAPADGKYNVITKLKKYSGVDGNGLVCYVDILLVKGSDGTVLAKEEKLDYGEIEWTKKNVKLAANEKVYILVIPNAASTKASSQNVGLLSFSVVENVQQQTTPGETTTPDNTDAKDATAPGETTTPDNTDANDTAAPDLKDNGDDAPASDVTPIIIVSIVGGVLLLATIIVVVVLRAKKKK